MIELFVALLDKLIDLVKKREEINRASFSDFLSPAMLGIEAVHNDYLASFARYREILKDKRIPLDANHPVFEKIKEDNLFSQQLRSRMVALEPLLDDEIFGEFLKSIHTYLWKATGPTTNGSLFSPVAMSIQRDEGVPPQVVRNEYARGLSRIFRGGADDRSTRANALSALESTVMQLQERYHAILICFTALQKKLLKPG
jgi:hypothetical protein